MSEFLTWESLYWPEGIPRSYSARDFKTIFSSNGYEAEIQSDTYSLNSTEFSILLSDFSKSISDTCRHGTFGVFASDPVLVTLSTIAGLLTDTNVAIVDREEALNACDAYITHGRTGADLASGLKIVKGHAVTESGRTLEAAPSLRFVSADGSYDYSSATLAGAIDSLSKFLRIEPSSNSVIVDGWLTEFSILAALASWAAGASLRFTHSAHDNEPSPSHLFLGRDSLSKSNALPRTFQDFESSCIVVDGSTPPATTKSLEKHCRVPVLPAFLVHGLGIVLANHYEFNVHGSVGIPLPNVEAIVVDNWEDSWTRSRLLMGPRNKGELVLRAPHLDAKRISARNLQAVNVSLGGAEVEWIATGVTGEMDENGFFYIEAREV